MKVPKLIDLNTKIPTAKPIDDQFKKAVIQQTEVENETVRRTFSIEKFYSSYIDKIATDLTQKQGKPVNASQALRIIIKRDMERAGQ